MEIKVTYHIEVMGQTSHEGQTEYQCANFEEGIRKLKSLRSSEVHVHLIKTKIGRAHV